MPPHRVALAEAIGEKLSDHNARLGCTSVHDKILVPDGDRDGKRIADCEFNQTVSTTEDEVATVIIEPCDSDNADLG
jgi:hypothetical protein